MYVIETKKIKKNRSKSVSLILKGAQLDRISRLRVVKKDTSLKAIVNAV